MTPASFTAFLLDHLERDGAISDLARFVATVTALESAELPPDRGGLGDVCQWLADHGAGADVLAAADVAWREYQRSLVGHGDPEPVVDGGDWQPATAEQERTAARLAQRFASGGAP